ncbi:MAG: 1-acyl-sn-glycerol-3-phosphate acyltransferase, partial [Micromonospora sp.]
MNGGELWRPTSGCGPSCLPPVTERAVPVLRRALRLVGVLGLLLAGIGLAALLPVLPARERASALRGWA